MEGIMKKLLSPVFLLILFIFYTVTVAYAEDKESVLVIKSGTIMTGTNGVLCPGSMLIKDGKITEIGKLVTTPKGAKIINAEGKYIIPGIVDPHSHIGVWAWPVVEPNFDGNEAIDPVTPQVRAIDSINFKDPAIERAIAAGVTTIHILPGSSNIIGGESVTIKLRPANTLDDFLFKGAQRGLKMAIGENPKRIYGNRGIMPSTRMGNAFVMRNAFLQAKEYMKKWEAFEKQKTENREAKPPARDLKMETLVKALQGELLIHVHCYKADGILTLFRIANEFGFKIRSFEHCPEAYKVPEIIKKHNTGVITFSDDYGFAMEAWNAIPYNAAILYRKGVIVSLHSDSANLMQRLNQEAAKCIKYGGLSEREALKLITINAAWMLGVEDRVGSLEVGKDADISIFNGNPFSVYSLCITTIIDGKIVYERTPMKIMSILRGVK
jgi:imidazolonepropionase-like amidohydrolase